MPRVLPLVLAVCTLVGAACGPSAGTATPLPAVGAPTPLPVATSVAPPPASPVTDPNSPPAVEAALQDAAAHLGVSAGQLKVESVEQRDWPDSSLGCPKPGLMYSQIVTPGFLIMLSGPNGKQLEYHTDGRARVVLCRES